MLLLVTILLVVVGAISLVIGYVQSSLPPIYLSIACSVVAFGVLLIFARMSSRNRAGTSTAGPAPLDFDRPQPAERTQAVPAMAGSGALGRSATAETFAPGDDDDDAGRYGGPASSGYAVDVDEDEDDDQALDDDFPIDRYDSRRVGEILPLLAELDVDELDIVREHEERGKGRATVLARIDQLIDQLEAEDRDEAAHRFDAEPEVDEAPLPPPPPSPPPPPAPQTVSVGALPEDDDDYFPIDDYDDLRASEILPLLPELDDDELEMVRRRESAEMGRQSILHRIDALLESSPTAPAGPGPVPAPQAVEPPPPAPEPEPVPDSEPVVSEISLVPPAKRPRATKATGRSSKASATSAPAPEVATVAPPAKAPAKSTRSTTKSAAAKTAQAAKAPARAAKAPAQVAKAAVGKAAKAVAPAAGPVQKTPPPRKKAAVEKAPAVKVVPAKKAQKGAGVSSTPAAKTTKKSSKR